MLIRSILQIARQQLTHEGFPEEEGTPEEEGACEGTPDGAELAKAA